MKDNKLLDNEIESISSFIKDVKKLPIVEGVFYETFENEKQYCRIVALYNTSLSYIKKMTVESGKIDVKTQRETMDNLCEYWNEIMEKDGIIFKVEDMNRYLASRINYSDFEAKRRFVYSNILFDRDGQVKTTQQTVKEHYKFETYSNLVDVENIDKLNIKVNK